MVRGFRFLLACASLLVSSVAAAQPADPARPAPAPPTKPAPGPPTSAGAGAGQSVPPPQVTPAIPPSSSDASKDDLIPAPALFQSAQALSALEVPVEWHLSEGVGHGIDQEGLRHGGLFLARGFGLRA